MHPLWLVGCGRNRRKRAVRGAVTACPAIRGRALLDCAGMLKCRFHSVTMPPTAYHGLRLPACSQHLREDACRPGVFVDMPKAGVCVIWMGVFSVFAWGYCGRFFRL